MIRYYELSDQGVATSVEPTQITDDGRKAVIFLGGILQQTAEPGQALRERLQSTCSHIREQTQIYLVVPSGTRNTDQSSSETPLPKAKDPTMPYVNIIARDLLFPDYKITVWKCLPQPLLTEEITAHLQHFILVGDSQDRYLLQQLENISCKILTSARLPLSALPSVQTLMARPYAQHNRLRALGNDVLNRFYPSTPTFQETFSQSITHSYRAFSPEMPFSEKGPNPQPLDSNYRDGKPSFFPMEGERISDLYHHERSIEEAIRDLLGDTIASQNTEHSHEKEQKPKQEEGDLIRHQALQRLLSNISLEDLKYDICTEVFDLHIHPDRTGIWKQTLLVLNEIQRLVPGDVLPWQRTSKLSLRDLCDIIDLDINEIIVRHLMRALQTLISQGQIHSDDAILMCEFVLETNDPKVNQQTSEALIDMAADLITPGNPLIYFSIGCGDGQADADLINRLWNQYPDQQILIAGMDTNALKMTHPFEYGFDGVMIPPPLHTNHKTYPTLAREAFAVPHADVLIVDRYALHHFGTPYKRIQELLDGCPMLSVDEPVNALERAHLWSRVTRIAYDLLMNWGFDMVKDQDWIIPALSTHSPQSEQFRILYRWAETLPETDTQIQGVYPRTDVIKYQPFQY
ncbi:hypothetical protein [Hahella ganghwensis]|uniref:hypothetical protein n=1 Tax=Hahella ganghwensis TaxID=286420 RepID=UPI000371C4F6|nr:hypothetical protein [Hahella ganghwensis]